MPLPQNTESLSSSPFIIGSGKEMEQVFDLVSQVASTNSTVLILGETGTGKELMAKTIHNNSQRSGKRMVNINCGALPSNLIESELFGHERGSFTGATGQRIGKFELANNGTIFLDEISDLPLDLQVKILRALQEKEIERVGGNDQIKIDVRFIAASNKNLQIEVLANRFRSDLYYRLNVFPITLPPLRNRKQDIPVLTFHFIERFAKGMGKKVSDISQEAMQKLVTYDWPGNIRELENMIERSVILTDDSTITEIHLSPKVEDVTSEIPGNHASKTIDENERDHILSILKKCNGKISGAGGAAELLGVPSSTLNSKMKKLGIEKEHFFKE